MAHPPLGTFFFCLSILFRLVLSLSPTYIQCQLQKSAGESALSGCPDGTLYVSAHDSSANFSSVQQAIDSLPQTGKAVILIGEGDYYEMLNVTRGAPLTLLGQLQSATAYVRAGNASQRNLVRVWNSRYYGENGWGDEDTATLRVAPSIGHPFGNTDFRAYNIDFENRAADYAVAPALVTDIVLANASFYGCTFASWQDTFYTGWAANTYVVDSIIFGQTDYIFGCGRAWFQSVTIANRACGGGITAWDGTSGTTNGVYIVDSKIIRSPEADSTTVTNGQCFLGRPWNEYAIAVFLSNYMDESINATGFTAWGGGDLPSTVLFAEFGSYGPGGNASARVQQDRILSSSEKQEYRLKHVFHETPGWIDFEYKH